MHQSIYVPIAPHPVSSIVSRVRYLSYSFLRIVFPNSLATCSVPPSFFRVSLLDHTGRNDPLAPQITLLGRLANTAAWPGWETSLRKASSNIPPAQMHDINTTRSKHDVSTRPHAQPKPHHQKHAKNIEHFALRANAQSWKGSLPICHFGRGPLPSPAAAHERPGT